MSAGAYVYLARRNKDLAVKVGYSADPCERVRGIGFKEPCELRAVFFAPTRQRARQIEAAAHSSLQRSRLDGEWFSVSIDEAKRTVSAAIEGKELVRLIGSARPSHDRASWRRSAP